MGAWKDNHLKRYYLFNIYNEYLGEFTKKQLSEKLNVTECVITSAIFRISVLSGKYYISKNKNFKIPKPKRYTHNPLFKRAISITHKDFRQMNLDFLLEYEIGIFNNQQFLF